MPTSELISTDPCTGEALWRGAPGDVDQAVAAARASARDWARSPHDYRIALVKAFQDAVLSRAEEFAVLISRETGKPLWESRTEVASVAAKVDISIQAQAERAGVRETSTAELRQAVRHKPHGVLAVLGPYNFPAHLPNGHIVPALLAGNAVVFKPSELTPAVAEFMLACWRASGAPKGLINVVQGGGEIGRALAAHPDIDGLLFTGSAATGAALARQFAETPQKVLALEMGGNNPLVVWDADDLVAVATLVLQSAYLSAGQRCTCARRLIVQQDRAEELVERLTALMDRLIVGAPFEEPQPFMGPVIDNRAAGHLVDRAARLASKGGSFIRPLKRIHPDRPFLTPALVDVTEIDDRDDEELFGPLLQLVRVRDFDAAMAEANRTRFGLSAGLIGGSVALYDRFWAASRAGVVNWNRPTNGAASSAPFGGIGLSGNHRPSAYYAADYCAWPVASLEADRPVAAPLTGLFAEAAR